MLVLRFCNADLSSSHGFVWPEKGHVKAEDWQATTACGNGLHGWLWGSGDSSASDCHKAADAKGLVVEVSEYIDLGGKIKFPEGQVVFCGNRTEAASYIISTFAPAGIPIIFGTATAGNDGTATAGNGGTATAGNDGTATAGNRGTATAGYAGTATAGDRGTLIIRYWDNQKSRFRIATAEVGEGGIEPNTPYRYMLSGGWKKVE